MAERERARVEPLDRLFARGRAASFLTVEADPDLPARVRAMSHAQSKTTSPKLWPRPVRAWTSFAAVVVLAAGLGAFVGHNVGTTSQRLTQQEVADADAFMAALSQGGFVDTLGHLGSTLREVNE